MKKYFPPDIKVVGIYVEQCIAVGSAFAMTFDSDEDIYQHWSEDDDEDVTWVW